MKKSEFNQLFSDYLASTTETPVKVSRGGNEFKVVGVNTATGYIEYDVGQYTDAYHYTRLKRV